jgi:hypothetical protein
VPNSVLPETFGGAHALIREWWTALRAVRAEQAALVTENVALRERPARLAARLGRNSRC